MQTVPSENVQKDISKTVKPKKAQKGKKKTGENRDA